jgi:cell division protease FtsH
MDGFGGDAGIVVMGATNRPDILDPALLRPGRFDRQVVVDVPDVHGRLEILELHAKGRSFAPEVDLYEIAKLCPGFSGAELANLVNEAALLSVREGSSQIDQATLEEAIDRVVAGPAKKSHVLTEGERWRIGIHEAGHAVTSRAIGQVVSAQKLSIVARGRQLGTAAHMLTDRDAVMHARSDLERHLSAILAGTAAEMIEFSEPSTGSSEDLHAATKLARQMVTSYGMSPKLGSVTIGEAGGEVFLGAALQDLGSIGPHTLDVIDEETERLVEEAKVRAEHVLRANWAAVLETAGALLEQETLSGLALDAVLSTVEEIEIDEIPLPERG